jgi:hypothetical protein
MAGGSLLRSGSTHFCRPRNCSETFRAGQPQDIASHFGQAAGTRGGGVKNVIAGELEHFSFQHGFF